MTTPLYLALIHYPIVNKHGQIVTTSVTNFDIHDLARTAKTFGAQNVFFVTPQVVQQKMIHTICEYWQEGVGARYNPDRKDALSIVKSSESLEECCLTIEKAHGIKPALLATTAKEMPQALTYAEARAKYFELKDKPVLLAFGTGHGLAPEFFDKTDAVLKPIYGAKDYNHLPVRAAVAIILDRLLRP